MGMRTLRPYQLTCLQAIQTAVSENRRRLLVRMATGGGKTFTFAHLPQILQARRTMVVAHRDELLKQAAKTFRSLGLSAEIEKAESVAANGCPVVVASVQTLRNGRLAKFNPADFDLLIIDECHHSCAPSYQRLVSHFNQAVVVGFTATPYRTDRKDLNDVFTDGVVFEMGLLDLVRQGYLAPIRTVTRKIKSNYAPKHVFRMYRRHASGLKSIVFCRDIEHSVSMAKTFSERGVPALPVYNGLGKDERESTLKKFAEGEIKVLTNCNVLTEGFDEPSIQCVVLARKTASRALYEQMVGRGTRLHESKSRLKVIKLIPTPPKPPVHWKVRAGQVWRWFKRLFWIGLLVTIGTSIWRHCNAPVQLPSVEETASQTQTKITTWSMAENCKVRKGPSRKARQIGVVREDQQVTKLEQKKAEGKTWTKIQVGSITGWCGCRVEEINE